MQQLHQLRPALQSRRRQRLPAICGTASCSARPRATSEHLDRRVASFDSMPLPVPSLTARHYSGLSENSITAQHPNHRC